MKRSRSQRRRSCGGRLSDEATAVLGDNGCVVELAAALGSTEPPRFLARGHRGVVFVTANGAIAIKRPRAPSEEVSWLRRCNALGIGPSLVLARDDCFAMAFASGTLVGPFLETATDAGFVRKTLRSLLEQCRTLDKAGINKAEMTCPRRHVVVHADATCTLLDFERCAYSARPQNVTQLCQYLSSAWVAAQLARLDIRLDTQNLRTAAAAYKSDQTDDAKFDAILASFGCTDLPDHTNESPPR